ncbi:MAG: hypothetical protein CMJ47_10715 [Planctomyces sp.]|nr:hypothetical protein [Planctomyces sp.]
MKRHPDGRLEESKGKGEGGFHFEQATYTARSKTQPLYGFFSSKLHENIWGLAPLAHQPTLVAAQG